MISVEARRATMLGGRRDCTWVPEGRINAVDFPGSYRVHGTVCFLCFSWLRMLGVAGTAGDLFLVLIFRDSCFFGLPQPSTLFELAPVGSCE